MKEADIFPIEVDLSLPTLRGMINDDDENDDENDESNGNDLFHDEQRENTFTQRQTAQDVDLLNIGQ